MAINPDEHIIDPTTGFAVHKDTGLPVGLAAKDATSATAEAPEIVAAREAAPEGDFPKWVVPHDRHIVREEGKPPVTPLFPEFHVNRANGEITVLVSTADEESLALSDAPAAAEEGAEGSEGEDADKSGEI